MYGIGSSEDYLRQLGYTTPSSSHSFLIATKCYPSARKPNSPAKDKYTFSASDITRSIGNSLSTLGTYSMRRGRLLSLMLLLTTTETSLVHVHRHRGTISSITSFALCISSRLCMEKMVHALRRRAMTGWQRGYRPSRRRTHRSVSVRGMQNSRIAALCFILILHLAPCSIHIHRSVQ